MYIYLRICLYIPVADFALYKDKNVTSSCDSDKPFSWYALICVLKMFLANCAIFFISHTYVCVDEIYPVHFPFDLKCQSGISTVYIEYKIFVVAYS